MVGAAKIRPGHKSKRKVRNFGELASPVAGLFLAVFVTVTSHPDYVTLCLTP